MFARFCLLPFRPRSNKGFTLPEMILTVIIMAILVSLSTPSIYEFMRQRDKQSEEMTQNEIMKALQAYMAANGEMPDDSATGTNAWYNKLASYTNLSTNEMANDTWGHPRMYLKYDSTNSALFGNNVVISYVTLFSMGPNGIAANKETVNGTTSTMAGIALDTSGKAYAGSSNASWWKGSSFASDTDKKNAFAALHAMDDDMMVRYTNYGEVMDRYNATQERMDKISQALETYSRSKYAAQVSLCAADTSHTQTTCNTDNTPVNLIYYPKSNPVYASGARADTATYANGTLFVNNQNNDTSRRTDMQALMKELGLPLDYCCSALEVSTLDKQPLPFYYFSNPRPRATNYNCSGTTSNCGCRPDSNATKLPARITTINNSDNSSDATCG